MKKDPIVDAGRGGVAGRRQLCPAQARNETAGDRVVRGYDKLLTNIDVVGQLGGNPDLGGLEMMLKMMTQGKGLAGLDTKQPWASVLMTDGQQRSPCTASFP